MNANLKKIYDFAPYGVKVALATMNGLKLNWWRGANKRQLSNEFLSRDQWSGEVWKTWQRERLVYMLKKASLHVPYYRNIWKNRSGNVERIEDWPILTKSDIRANPELFISEEHKGKKLYRITSSGTSGTPMNYYFDRQSMSRWYALIDCRLRSANGVTEKMNWANIGGQLVTAINRSKPPFWTWNAAMNQLYMSSYHFKLETVGSYAEALARYRVEYMYGYSSSLYGLARLSLESGIPLPKMRVAITNAEPLFENQRNAIAQAFGCDVIQTYGGSEFAFGGSECHHGKMHLWPDAGYIEVVDFEKGVHTKAGDVGKFVVTGLVNEAMPLIRFEIGDAGALAEENLICSCGRNTPLIKKIEGRNDDLILTKDGRRVGRLDPVFKSNLRIKEAQIIQLSRDQLEVKVLPAPGYTAADELDIRQRLVERLGDIQIRFVSVDNIPRGPNGKFKAVVSYVKN